MTVRFTSTGSYTGSRMGSGAYYAYERGKCLGIVRKLSNGKWYAVAEFEGRLVATSLLDLQTRLAAGEWLSAKVKELQESSSASV